jgi:ribosome-binding protein aMBF1 (putative translation factor)
MDWNPNQIKKLRKRMGWSQADLAQKLALDCKTVQSWEEGFSCPLDFQLSGLEMISRQADQSAQDLSQSTVAEMQMEQQNLGQVAPLIFDKSIR